MKALFWIALFGGGLYYLSTMKKKEAPKKKVAPPSKKPVPDATDYKTFTEDDGTSAAALSKYMSGTGFDQAVQLDLEGWD